MYPIFTSLHRDAVGNNIPKSANVCYKLSTISQEQKLTHVWIIIIIIIARLSANVL